MLILNKNKDLKMLEKFCPRLEGRGERVCGVT
jgi:hypothetical protein